MKNNFVDLPVTVAMQSDSPGFASLQWAKKNCPSYITNDVVQIGGVYYYRFYFGHVRDITAFTLKWS